MPTIAAIDVETTGLDARSDRIVEIAVVVMRDERVVARRAWLVHPECSIPRSNSEVHGITNRHVRTAPRFAEIAGELLGHLRNATPLAYNAPFDRSFLACELERARRLLPEDEWIDPMRMARAQQLPSRSYRLVDVAAHFGIRPRRFHRALDDAETALEVYRRLRDACDAGRRTVVPTQGA